MWHRYQSVDICATSMKLHLCKVFKNDWKTCFHKIKFAYLIVEVLYIIYFYVIKSIVKKLMCQSFGQNVGTP